MRSRKAPPPIRATWLVACAVLCATSAGAGAYVRRSAPTSTRAHGQDALRVHGHLGDALREYSAVMERNGVARAGEPLPLSSSSSALSVLQPLSSSTPPKPFGVTLVMQASADRCWMLADICSRWGGPIALAVFVPFRQSHSHAAAAGGSAGAGVGGGGGLDQGLGHELSSLLGGGGGGEGSPCAGKMAYAVHVANSHAEANEYPVNVLRNKVSV